MSINPFQDSGVSEVPEANDKYADGQEPFVDGVDNDVFGPNVDHSKTTVISHGQPGNFGRPVSAVGADGRPTVVIPYTTTDIVVEQPGFLERLRGKQSEVKSVVVQHGEDVRGWLK